MNGYGNAHGKVILMGEHSVVYGYPAIALPFQQVKVQCVVSRYSGEIWLESDFYTGALKDAPPERAHLATAVDASLDYLQQAKKNLKITIISDLPASRGLGSSAAVAVALIRALFQYFERQLQEEELILLANQAERVAHGNPSGIDVLTTAFSQPVWFRRSLVNQGIKELKPFPVSLPAYLVVADTAIYGQTKEAIAIIAQKRETEPEETERLLHELGDFALQAGTAIVRQDCYRLGELMSSAHRNLQALGVSHAVLDHLTDQALRQGALGAKLTGGGLGGCMICLSEDEKNAQAIAGVLQQEGAKRTWIYPLKDR